VSESDREFAERITREFEEATGERLGSARPGSLAGFLETLPDEDRERALELAGPDLPSFARRHQTARLIQKTARLQMEKMHPEPYLLRAWLRARDPEAGHEKRIEEAVLRIEEATDPDSLTTRKHDALKAIVERDKWAQSLIPEFEAEQANDSRFIAEVSRGEALRRVEWMRSEALGRVDAVAVLVKFHPDHLPDADGSPWALTDLATMEHLHEPEAVGVLAQMIINGFAVVGVSWVEGDGADAEHDVRLAPDFENVPHSETVVRGALGLDPPT